MDEKLPTILASRDDMWAGYVPMAVSYLFDPPLVRPGVLLRLPVDPALLISNLLRLPGWSVLG